MSLFNPENEPADPLTMWVIYERPTDFPDWFVVRAHRVMPDGSVQIDREARFAKTLEEARVIVPRHLINLGRSPDDDPKIIEVWI